MSFSLVEEFWFGDFPDEVAEQAAATSVVATIADIAGLRPFPVAAQQLLDAVAKSDFDVREVGAIIERDTSLASRLLRSVNSPAFGLRHRAASVQQAVLLLGARAISETAAGLVVMEMFSDATGLAATVRDHSVRVASLARFLALQASTAPDLVCCTT